MIASLTLLLGSIVMRDPLPPCTFDQPATLVERMADLPPGVISAFDAGFDGRFGGNRGTAEVGADFESTDDIGTWAPRRRFIRAYRIGEVWIIWYEQGGVERTRRMVALAAVRGGDGDGALRALSDSHFGGDLCLASKAYLAGAWSY